MLADLGFSNIILQFAAHEFAFLRFDERGRIVGSDDRLKRLSTFFVFSLKWMGLILLTVFPAILAAGFILLSRKTTELHWAAPWTIHALGAALTFVNGMVLYFFEGCDSVGEAQAIRVKIFSTMSVVMCAGLVMRVGLFALSFSLLLSSVAGAVMIINRFGPAISQMWTASRTYAYSWRNEFMSLFWRYAISWASGYFIFQMYTPIMFYFHGAVAAGKVGITLTLWMGVFSMANVWVYAVTPKLNMFISKRDWKSLDAVFFRNLAFSFLTFLAGAAAVLSVVAVFTGKVKLAGRFLDLTSMSILAAAWLMQIIVNALAVYLRAHKEEPLVLPSLVSALYVAVMTYFCARHLPAKYFFAGFLSSYLFGLPWVIGIFRRKRARYHVGA